MSPCRSEDLKHEHFLILLTSMQKLSGCSSAPRYLARTHCSRHKPNFQHFKFALESFSSFKRKYESTSSFKRNYDSQIEPRDATRCRCSTALSPQTADNIPEHSAEDSIEQNQNFNGAVKWFYAFFKFTRPHTMLGTLVSIVSVSLLALVLPLAHPTHTICTEVAKGTFLKGICAQSFYFIFLRIGLDRQYD